MSATTNETVNTTAAAPKVDDAKTTGGAAKTDAAAGEEKPVVVKPELKGHRIHIGNLPFKATEEDVRALVAKANVEILEVTIPQRTGRPAGYAFVAFNTEEDSKKAMEALADEEIEGRKIKLQAARSPEEQAERRAEVAEQRKAEKKAEKAEKAKLAAEKKAAEGGDAVEAGKEVEGETKPKKKRSSKKGPRRRIPGQEDEEAEGEATETADGAAPAEDAEVKTAKPKKKKSSKSRKAREARIDGGATEGEEAAPGAEGATEAGETRKPREKKAKKPRQVPTGQPSATTVFVANLPFEVDDAKLAEIFTNLSIRVTSAKVVTGVRRNREGRSFRGSRGFGFVEVEDPAQQKEAVEKVEGSLIGDRTLSAKIANEMKTVEEQEVKEAVKEEEGVKKEEGAGSPAQVSSSAN